LRPPPPPRAACASAWLGPRLGYASCTLASPRLARVLASVPELGTGSAPAWLRVVCVWRARGLAFAPTPGRWLGPLGYTSYMPGALVASPRFSRRHALCLWARALPRSGVFTASAQRARGVASVPTPGRRLGPRPGAILCTCQAFSRPALAVLAPWQAARPVPSRGCEAPCCDMAGLGSALSRSRFAGPASQHCVDLSLPLCHVPLRTAAR